MNEIDNDRLERMVIDAHSQRGGKPTKYTGFDKYPEIIELIKRDVQLPFILKWLTDEKMENLVLNTLRKYVVFKIGRVEYEAYLKRNGWLKTKKNAGTRHGDTTMKLTPATPTTAAENPLRVLSGKPKDGDHNPIPTAIFEVDNS